MIEMSEVRLYVTGDERLLRHVGVSDFLKPAWRLLRQRRIGWVTCDRFVWCDECLHWNCHSLHEEDEEVAGLIIKRYPNCECRIGSLIYSMGMADGELAKMLRLYPSSRMMNTPPPVRRVGPADLLGVGTEASRNLLNAGRDRARLHLFHSLAKLDPSSSLDLGKKKPGLQSGASEPAQTVAV
jgi:hypothetical protein